MCKRTENMLFLLEEKLYGLTKNQINAGGTSLKYIGTLYKSLVFRVIKYLLEQYKSYRIRSNTVEVKILQLLN